MGFSSHDILSEEARYGCGCDATGTSGVPREQTCSSETKRRQSIWADVYDPWIIMDHPCCFDHF